ncbi:oligopeptide transport system substrate-binding protein [Isoptericola jiangsuensis]|uniref:Oligopeptide transport system substrate-binding protein n=1 Tax=Isoptericola jiangsuensis TaxID=548579 RepID=A0A2A9EV86_9MICO|nr:ABC transporter substrate-binding protein [Isoptericola jiangsuensis]PFG42476.1 oligopeptide transport system substrate-binding protein [Isoptericola jiangsuensis]
MTPRRLAGIGAFTLASALLLSACGSSGSDDSDSAATGDDAAAGTGIVSVSSGEPQNPLTPGMTNEVYGGLVVKNIYSGLVYYDADGAIQNEVAESIESEDNKTWTITLQDGWTFSDGTPVTASSFVDAWKYTANLENAQNQQYFFNGFEGFSFEENSDIAVEATDDLTITAELSVPSADFPLWLGYSAFYPLPESFFENPDSFNEEPVGNGPYVIDSWTHDQEISLVPNESYEGPRTPANGGLDLVAYTEEDTAYNDLLGGNLDVLPNVPSSAFATFEDELGDRAVNQPAALIQVVNVPEWLPEFQGEAGVMRRQAISLSIDRDTITEQLYSGSRTPAKDFTSPVIDGYSEDIPGSEVLTYDPEQAKELWDEAESMDPIGDYTLNIASNADSDHQDWIDAVCTTIRQDLEIGCEFAPYTTFDEFLDARDNGKVEGLFRGGWQADWPSMSNFLGPIYGTGAGSNDAQYSSEAFDAKLAEAAAAPDTDTATTLYKEAQEILFADLPGIPLWYQNATGGYSENVENVAFGWDSDPILYQISKQ